MSYCGRGNSTRPLKVNELFLPTGPSLRGAVPRRWLVKRRRFFKQLTLCQALQNTDYESAFAAGDASELANCPFRAGKTAFCGVFSALPICVGITKIWHCADFGTPVGVCFDACQPLVSRWLAAGVDCSRCAFLSGDLGLFCSVRRCRHRCKNKGYRKKPDAGLFDEIR